ncbi:MAG TPA: AbrB/MazE/SpoVT family DNA-binding domain-containing protein [Solirubrobacteraceae bacterium]|nr:AbrB/MazE/SpoVT family DNA-binding domain-containing protein [Solirubrobacteraceae bacterium]
MRTKISEKGQITVPKPLRDRLGIRPGDELDVIDDGGRLVLSRAMPDDPVAAVYGILDTGRSTDEIIEELRGPVDAV